MTRPTGGAPGDFCADPAEAQTPVATAVSQRQSLNRAVLLVFTERALHAERFHARQCDAHHNVGSGGCALPALSTCRKLEPASRSFCQLIFLLLGRKSRHDFDPS
jgi:hypothetical protein